MTTHSWDCPDTVNLSVGELKAHLLYTADPKRFLTWAVLDELSRRGCHPRDVMLYIPPRPQRPAATRTEPPACRFTEAKCL
jgi:hypothetical protein